MSGLLKEQFIILMKGIEGSLSKTTPNALRSDIKSAVRILEKDAVIIDNPENSAKIVEFVLNLFNTYPKETFNKESLLALNTFLEKTFPVRKQPAIGFNLQR